MRTYLVFKYRVDVGLSIETGRAFSDYDKAKKYAYSLVKTESEIDDLYSINLTGREFDYFQHLSLHTVDENSIHYRTLVVSYKVD